jgi:hypothetical protein
MPPNTSTVKWANLKLAFVNAVGRSLHLRLPTIHHAASFRQPQSLSGDGSTCWCFNTDISLERFCAASIRLLAPSVILAYVYYEGHMLPEKHAVIGVLNR